MRNIRTDVCLGLFLCLIIKEATHMDTAVLLEYAWVLIVLIGLEGLLAADNAVVLAVMVRHLDPVRRKKALFYVLIGAFVFRVLAILLLLWLVLWWCDHSHEAVYYYADFIG